MAFQAFPFIPFSLGDDIYFNLYFDPLHLFQTFVVLIVVRILPFARWIKLHLTTRCAGRRLSSSFKSTICGDEGAPPTPGPHCSLWE